MFYVRALLQHVGTSNHFIDSSKTQLGHQFSEFFCNKKEIVDDVFRLSSKLFAQFRILSGNTNRTGIEVTFAHHNAANCNQWNCRKTILFRTQQSSNRHVPSSFKLSINLQTYPSTHMIQHQCLLSLGKPQFPRNSSVFY